MTCQRCGAELEKQVGRGRPRKYCPACPKPVCQCGSPKSYYSLTCQACTTRPSRPVEERFLTHVTVLGPDDCWLWEGSKRTGGGKKAGTSEYGSFGTGIAHRVAYELWVGPIPEGWDVDHTCRVTLCVNPAHLEAVTKAENARRAAIARGARDLTAILLTVDADTMSIRDWARDTRCQVSLTTLVNRVDAGWEADRAVLIPPTNRGRRI